MKQALGIAPMLNPKIHCVIQVPDGVFDPLRLGLAFAATAKSNGTKFKPYHNVKELILEQGRVVGIRGNDLTNHQPYELRGDIIINATGVWTNQIITQFGAPISMTICPGMMVAIGARIAKHAPSPYA